MTDTKHLRVKMSDQLKRKVLERDAYRCQICGASRDVDGALLHIDHIYPASKGGTNELSNLQALCQGCNVGKGAVTPEQFSNSKP